MGAIRWTAKGMKLIGDILDSDDVEKWLEAKGRKYIEEQVTKLPAKWFAGHSRARRKLSKEILGIANRSDVLRAALDEHLSKLPEVVLEVAKKGARSLVREVSVSESPFSMVACPRGLIVNLYSERIVKALKDSAELQRYEGLPESSLAQIARLSEQSYFNESNHPDLSAKARIVGTDDDFKWDLFNFNGHYYVLILDSYSEDLSFKNIQRKLNDFVIAGLQKLKVRFGELTATQHKDLRRRMLAL